MVKINYYVKIIRETIRYIEDNLNENILLEDLASQSYLSKFHFNRIFKTVSGMTLKQYIQGRKFTESIKYLSAEEMSVKDVAYKFGYQYPEVFSRAFKKQFGVPPSAYDTVGIEDNIVKKASIAERDIVNYKGNLVLDDKIIFLEDKYLLGVFVDVNVDSEDFKSLMDSTANKFMADAKKLDYLKQEKLYTIVKCHEDDTGEYSVFYGLESKCKKQNSSFEEFLVTEGYYAGFSYRGDMYEIRETFIDDFYRWIMAKDIKLRDNGIGMLNIFDENYFKNKEVQILVPIEEKL